MQTTLNLWLENQPEAGFNQTRDYIQNAPWVPPEGVTVSTDGGVVLLSGASERLVWTAFDELAAAVAASGHGDMSDADAEELGEPRLTACPAELVGSGAAEELARQDSLWRSRPKPGESQDEFMARFRATV